MATRAADCPNCGSPKVAGQGYCRQCKNSYQRDWRMKQKTKNVSRGWHDFKFWTGSGEYPFQAPIYSYAWCICGGWKGKDTGIEQLLDQFWGHLEGIGGS